MSHWRHQRNKLYKDLETDGVMGPTAAEEERLGNPKKILNLAPFLLIELGMEIFCTAKPSEVCQAIWQCINQADFHYTKEYLRKHTPGLSVRNAIAK